MTVYFYVTWFSGRKASINTDYSNISFENNEIVMVSSTLQHRSEGYSLACFLLLVVRQMKMAHFKIREQLPPSPPFYCITAKEKMDQTESHSLVDDYLSRYHISHMKFPRATTVEYRIKKPLHKKLRLSISEKRINKTIDLCSKQ